MNSTFKVVFNKARGALMVVNEITSSVQVKKERRLLLQPPFLLLSPAAPWLQRYLK